MRKKRTINLAVPEELLQEFNEVCRHYGHGKQKGLVLSAAVLSFLKLDPREQGKLIEEVLRTDVDRGVVSMLDRARRAQHDAVKAADDATPRGQR